MHPKQVSCLNTGQFAGGDACAPVDPCPPLETLSPLSRHTLTTHSRHAAMDPNPNSPNPTPSPLNLDPSTLNPDPKTQRPNPSTPTAGAVRYLLVCGVRGR